MKRTDNTQEYTERPHGESAPVQGQATRIARTLPTSSQMNDMVALFHKELELCGVKAGEKVAVLSEVGRQTEYTSAFMIAARDLGGEVFREAHSPASAPRKESSAVAQHRAGEGVKTAHRQDTQTRSRLFIGQNGPSDSARAAARGWRLRRPAADRHAARCASRDLCSGGAPRRYTPSSVTICIGFPTNWLP